MTFLCCCIRCYNVLTTSIPGHHGGPTLWEVMTSFVFLIGDKLLRFNLLLNITERQTYLFSHFSSHYVSLSYTLHTLSAKNWMMAVRWWCWCKLEWWWHFDQDPATFFVHILTLHRYIELACIVREIQHPTLTFMTQISGCLAKTEIITVGSTKFNRRHTPRRYSTRRNPSPWH